MREVLINITKICCVVLFCFVFVLILFCFPPLGNFIPKRYTARYTQRNTNPYPNANENANN